MPVLLSVSLVLALVCGCAGYAFGWPAYQRHQLRQVYNEVSFVDVFGFVPPIGNPVLDDDGVRVAETWHSDLELSPQEDFVERSLSSLYEWARNTGSTAPREDFAECYQTHCQISWVYHGSHQISIAMSVDRTADLPTWQVAFFLEPL